MMAMIVTAILHYEEGDNYHPNDDSDIEDHHGGKDSDKDSGDIGAAHHEDLFHQAILKRAMRWTKSSFWGKWWTSGPSALTRNPGVLFHSTSFQTRQSVLISL